MQTLAEGNRSLAQPWPLNVMGTGPTVPNSCVTD